jgi:hypothetical protein
LGNANIGRRLILEHSLKYVLEESVKQERFSGRKMFQEADDILKKQETMAATITDLSKKLKRADYEYIITALLRTVFLIELVNDDISSTKMEVRWIKKESKGKKQEVFDQSDPRFSTFEECVNILTKLLSELQYSVGKTEIELLKTYRIRRLIPYEIPIDYVDSPLTQESITSIHASNNVQWIWGEEYQKTLKLRNFLMDSKRNSLADLFSSILKDKIKVKTYLTDRVQTGDHKTNREKRWEVHPESVHFAFRRNCLEIERRLVTQLCHFEHFPSNLYDLLIKEDMIVEENKPYRCPVTLDPLSFKEFEEEVKNPLHGRSNFQVGHLNPLKLMTDDPASGHIQENIGWFSADGNRIQGSLSLNETRKLLQRIQDNYSKLKGSQ